jgi:hypothetical protein
MKTEDEIRGHALDLLAGAEGECDCEGLGHDPVPCRTGRMLMGAVARALLWSLGEEESYQPMVDRVAELCRPASRN